MPIAPVNSTYGEHFLSTFSIVHFKATFIGKLDSPSTDGHFKANNQWKKTRGNKQPVAVMTKDFTLNNPFTKVLLKLNYISDAQLNDRIFSLIC